MPPSLAALLQSGDHPSQKLLGGTRSASPTAELPRLSSPTPVRLTAAGTSRRGTPLLDFPPAMVELEGRDPFSLWVHWQVDESNLPAGWSLRLRIFAHSLDGPWMLEQPVSASGHRTLPVLYANTVYLAALGIVSESGSWNPVAVSTPVRTAPDGPSLTWASETALFPSGQTGEEPSTERTSPIVVPTIPTTAVPDVATATFLTALATESLGWTTDPNSSGSVAVRSRPPLGSLEAPDRSITPPPGSAVWTAESAPVPGSVPVPPPAPPGPTGFWFKVHAELVLHGSTEPGASITIAGHPVRLRDDGSFTFRFSLPNGSFDLPVEAVKADGSDRRSAHLTVSRQTVERGEVGVHPIEPSLRPPLVESLR